MNGFPAVELHQLNRGLRKYGAHFVLGFVHEQADRGDERRQRP
jgi:hypothetical protein